jgi:hypothetical protein
VDRRQDRVDAFFDCCRYIYVRSGMDVTSHIPEADISKVGVAIVEVLPDLIQGVSELHNRRIHAKESVSIPHVTPPA